MNGAGPAARGGSPRADGDLAWRVALAALARLPQGALSRAFGRLADVPIPRPLRRPVLASFARVTGIDASEAEHAFEHYPTLDSFFVRRLRPGARSWPAAADVAGSPVDGVLGQLGPVHGGALLQAKGRTYSAAALLNDDRDAASFEGGEFLTIYLSPRHYHRIHTPTAGEVREASHVPGSLLPVNAAAVRHVSDLFARNERLICHVDGPLGRIAVVAIGATNVGRISAAFDEGWNRAGGRGAVTNRRRAAFERRVYSPGVPLEQGDEIMAFHLGSTVVLLFAPGRAKLVERLRPGAEIALGEPIAVRS